MSSTAAPWPAPLSTAPADEPRRRAGEQLEAAELVIEADAVEDRTRPIDSDVADARRLAALPQPHLPIEAVRTAPALSGRDSRGRVGSWSGAAT